MHIQNFKKERRCHQYDRNTIKAGYKAGEILKTWTMFYNFVNRKLFQQLRIYKTFAEANT